MAKLSLNDLTNLNTPSITTLNANFEAIEEAIENTLSRDGTSPNPMEADIDMDGNDILNGGLGDFQILQVNGVTVTASEDLLSIPDEMIFQELGVGGASPDSTNKLAVASDAVLFNKATDDIQVKLNKQATGDTASFVFQTNFSGRAEIGNIGDSNFVFKTSADGNTFDTGLTLVTAANGVPKLPSFAVASLPSAATAGAGAIVYCTNGNAGAACFAVSDGTNWKRIALGATVSAS